VPPIRVDGSGGAFTPLPDPRSGGKEGPLARAAAANPGWLVVLGTKEAARAPWFVDDSGSTSLLEEGVSWPSAARVAGHTIDAPNGMVYLRVESLAAPGQRAGLFGVVPIRLRRGWTPHGLEDLEVSLRLAGARSDGELDARRRALQRRPASGPPRAELAALLQRAGQSTRALLRAVPAEGLTYSVIRQDRYFIESVLLTPGELPRAPMLGRVLSLVRGYGGWPCQRELCASDEGLLSLRRSGRGHQLDGVIDARPASPHLPSHGVPAAVPARRPSQETHRIAADLLSRPEVLSEAPLSSAGGVIAVAVVRRGKPGFEEQAAWMITIEGVAVSARRLARHEQAWQVRFVDVDADGRTDVLLGAPGARGDACAAYLAPRQVEPSSRTELGADELAGYYLADAPSLGAAVRALSAAPHGPPPPLAAARAAVARGRLAPGARAFLLSDDSATPPRAVRPPPPGRDLLPACVGEWKLAFGCDRRRPICHAQCVTGITALPYSERSFVFAERDGRQEIVLITEQARP